MTEKPLDDWHDRMIAALYGELDDEQMREFEAQLEQDEGLAQEWRELSETRASLQRLAEAEPVPEHHRGSSLQLPHGVGQVATFPRWRWALASSAGFAAAATLFLALLVAGLRVDQTPAGLLVSFGGGSAEELVSDPYADGAHITAVDGGRQRYLTRAEFASVAQMMMEATTARLDELERRQSSSHMEATWALYDALATSQQRRFDELRAQIQLAAYQAGGGGPYGGSTTGWPNAESPTKEKIHDYE
jgi:hypothetical protein